MAGRPDAQGSKGVLIDRRVFLLENTRNMDAFEKAVEKFMAKPESEIRHFINNTIPNGGGTKEAEEALWRIEDRRRKASIAEEVKRHQESLAQMKKWGVITSVLVVLGIVIAVAAWLSPKAPQPKTDVLPTTEATHLSPAPPVTTAAPPAATEAPKGPIVSPKESAPPVQPPE